MARRSDPITVRVLRDAARLGGDQLLVRGELVALPPVEAAALARRGVVSLTRELEAPAAGRGRYARRDLRAEP